MLVSSYSYLIVLKYEFSPFNIVVSSIEK